VSPLKIKKRKKSAFMSTLIVAISFSVPCQIIIPRLKAIDDITGVAIINKINDIVLMKSIPNDILR